MIIDPLQFTKSSVQEWQWRNRATMIAHNILLIQANIAMHRTSTMMSPTFFLAPFQWAWIDCSMTIQQCIQPEIITLFQLLELIILTRCRSTPLFMLVWCQSTTSLFYLAWYQSTISLLLSTTSLIISIVALVHSPAHIWYCYIHPCPGIYSPVPSRGNVIGNEEHVFGFVCVGRVSTG